MLLSCYLSSLTSLEIPLQRKKSRLTDTAIKSAKPGVTLPDGERLYLRVSKTQHKAFIFRYQDLITKRPVNYTLGPYPALTLKRARTRRDELSGLRSRLLFLGEPRLPRQRVQRRVPGPDGRHQHRRGSVRQPDLLRR